MKKYGNYELEDMTMMKLEEKIKKLYQLVVEISLEAPTEEDCTEVENDLFAEVSNMKQAIEDYLETRTED